MSERFTVRTGSRSDFIDITAQVRQALGNLGITDGMCHVSIPHTTAGVTINENADPDVQTDLISILDALIPWRGGYRHSEGNSAAHLKASMMGFTANIPIENGALVLGTWQCVYFCEFDGPRTRTVIVTATRS
jgi:secondary thiamine-phosphate synthase enzyme